MNYLKWGNATIKGAAFLHQNVHPQKKPIDVKDGLEKSAYNWFISCYNKYQQKREFLSSYIVQYSDCIIEPKFGWGISNNKLLFYSISNNTWKESLYPDYNQYLNHKSKCSHYDKLISIRMIRGGEDNYWHFLHDILGQIMLAKKNNLDKTYAFLISKNLSEKKYFQDAVKQSSYLQSIRFVVQQDGEYIHADDVVFIQSLPHDEQTFYGLIDILEIPDTFSDTQRKIFLTRNNSRLRHLINEKEIIAIASKHGFETVDADYLSLQEQIALFGQTAFLIGTHGAGLINIMFRKNAPLKLFELFPSDYIPPHYYWLSKDLGYGYLCQVGSAMNKKGGFSIDPVLFEEKVKQLINT